MSTKITIENVSDTALWVAYYRVLETERPDALFQDPLAKVLVGERGKQIAENMKATGRYTQWAVVSRTVMIDEFIQNLIKEGVDTIINLGAGLDTRPYRMSLPQNLKWIEIDQPQIISLKNEKLKSEKPVCELSRFEIDLSQPAQRKDILSKVTIGSKKTLVLTEGVLPYLSEDEVTSLAKDLQDQPSIQYWIAEYFDPAVYKYLKSSLRTQKMKNAPFRFFPANWIGFFEERGWAPLQIRYSSEVAQKYNRKIPMPLIGQLFKLLAPRKMVEKMTKVAGYMIFKKK
jgi:methyltransferase (TIGR00027 family)